MAAPDDPAARSGLEAARRAVDEHDRALEERRAEPPPPDDRPVGWFARRGPEERGDAGSPAVAPRPGGSRVMLGAAAASVFVALGAVVSANWNGMMLRLTQAPVPRDGSVAFSSMPAARAEDQTITAARRLLDSGQPARAVQLLDSVSPEQPAYPFARQLRIQAERALRQGETRR
jgi:hypothetical protein